MSTMYSPLDKSIELLEKDKSRNPYISLSLMNLKSHKQNVKLTEDKSFGKTLMLNEAKQQNERMKFELREINQEYEKVKQEKENIEVYSDARINNLTEKANEKDERINNLLEAVSIRNLTINVLNKFNDNLEDTKKKLEEKMSKMKRKSEANHKQEKKETKRRRFVSA